MSKLERVVIAVSLCLVEMRKKARQLADSGLSHQVLVGSMRGTLVESMRSVCSRET